MKLEPVFYVENNQLRKIKDKSSVNYKKFRKIQISWREVELKEECYNESYLAKLRDDLKKLELKKEYVILVPKVDRPLKNPQQEELFINAFKHTARREKDCTSVVGFEVPQELQNKEAFIETLSVKHEQYIYFSKTEISTQHAVIRYQM